MRLEDFKEKSLYINKLTKNQYLVYSINPGKYLNRQFYCMVEKVSNGKFKVIPSKHSKTVFKDDTLSPTNNIEDLLNKIDNYIKSLPFHTDTYYPQFRENCFYEYACAEYLKNIGFKYSKENTDIDNLFEMENRDVFGKPNKIIIGIFGIHHLDDESKNVTIKIYNSLYEYVSKECEKDITQIINSLNDFLIPYFIGNSVNQFSICNKIKHTMSKFDGVKQIKFNPDTLEFSQNNFKDILIERLENMLTVLKS